MYLAVPVVPIIVFMPDGFPTLPFLTPFSKRFVVRVPALFSLLLGTARYLLRWAALFRHTAWVTQSIHLCYVYSGGSADFLVPSMLFGRNEKMGGKWEVDGRMGGSTYLVGLGQYQHLYRHERKGRSNVKIAAEISSCARYMCAQ